MSRCDCKGEGYRQHIDPALSLIWFTNLITLMSCRCRTRSKSEQEHSAAVSPICFRYVYICLAYFYFICVCVCVGGGGGGGVGLDVVCGGGWWVDVCMRLSVCVCV